MGKANMFTFSCYCINRYTELSNYMSVSVSFPSGLLSGQSTYVPCLNLLLSKNKLQVGRRPVQFSSVSQSCPTLCNPKYCSTQGLPVHHELPEITQTHVHWVSDAIQPPRLLSSPSSLAFNLSQNQGLFKWVSSSHQVAKVLEFQLQHQSFQRIFRTDFL